MKANPPQTNKADERASLTKQATDFDEIVNRITALDRVLNRQSHRIILFNQKYPNRRSNGERAYQNVRSFLFSVYWS